MGKCGNEGGCIDFLQIKCLTDLLICELSNFANEVFIK